jgi:hypothetical protein
VCRDIAAPQCAMEVGIVGVGAAGLRRDDDGSARATSPRPPTRSTSIVANADAYSEGEGFMSQYASVLIEDSHHRRDRADYLSRSVARGQAIDTMRRPGRSTG